ncbi:adhesion G protein-coupled receptor F5-like isoform X2 [Hyperolius riggenbachi]|uniref:adhesion G protein-coupled receptor F5-like isoform X2 n=1 Tax=Hyperolius riggenbachi TaxID=752182 RepID=UPI0035A3842D
MTGLAACLFQEHEDHSLDTLQDRSLSRHKRAATSTSNASVYILDIEISFPDPAYAKMIRDFIQNNITSLSSADFNVTSVNVTTMCNQTGSGVQCTCENGFTWSSSACTSPCPGTSPSNCNCITASQFPTQYCQPKTVNLDLSMKLQRDFTSDYLNSASQAYKTLSSSLEAQFTTSYTASLPGFKSASVTGFRPGSVIADYTVVTEPASSATITTANQALITNLAPTFGIVSITNVVPGWASISVSPISSYIGDKVTLTCSVNVTSYSAVSWYFNSVQKIENTSYSSFTIVPSAAGIQTILTINSAMANDSGSYQCQIDETVSSYAANTSLNIHSLTISSVSSVVTCNNVPVSIAQCCTDGGSMAFTLSCGGSGLYTESVISSSSTCQAYTVTANSNTCSPGATNTYSCTCSSGSGAVQSGNYPVSFQSSYQSAITGFSDISEWNALSLTCNCNATNVGSMSWYFISAGSGNNSIDTSLYKQSSPGQCVSTLTIPSGSLSVSWNGTFNCLVNNGALSASKTVVVYRLAKQSLITVSPITASIQKGTNVTFSCCVNNPEVYSTVSLQTSNSGSIAMTRVPPSNCFTAQYSPMVGITATCTLTNQISSTVTSNQMTVNIVEVASCNDPVLLAGAVGSTTTVPCKNIYPDQTGNINYICAESGQWIQTGSTCVSAALSNLKDELDALTSPGAVQAAVTQIVSQLSSNVTTLQANVSTSVQNLQLVVSILQAVAEKNDVVDVKETVMASFLQTVNVVVDNSSTWNNVQNKTSQSSNLLQSVERFAQKLNFTNNIEITENNVQLRGSVVSNTSDYNATFDFDKMYNLTGNVTVNTAALNSSSSKIVSVAYATLKDILGDSSNANNTTSNKTVNGLVITTVMSSAYNNGFFIGMDFKKSNATLKNASCVYWNFTLREWDTSGCTVQSSGDKNVLCNCSHLTPFSILMSTNNPVFNPPQELTLTLITYIGVGISILSLVVCIIIEATVWKSVTKNKTSYMRHVCIMNIAVTLLMADIWFIVGAAMSDQKKMEACIAATFFTHLFYLCTFFWMLTMGLILFYRLMCVFHDLSKTTMMGISFFLGYGCPIIISVITVGVTQSRSTYLAGEECWLNMTESKAFLAFVIPALSILLVNFITLLVVIVKVLRPSVGDRPKKEEKSTLNHIAKCILILTPLLGLTWGFGIGVMASSSFAIHVIFAALNSLQGLFILLFGCLLDKKVRDALFSRFSISRWSSQQTKSSNLSSTESPFSKGVINLFPKKGVYNISSAQSGSSSEMASSNSYSLLT